MRCSCVLRVVLCTVYIVLCSLLLISVCYKLIHPRTVTQRTNNTGVTLVLPPGTVYTAATSSCWRRSGRVGGGTRWRQARWWRRGGSEREGGGGGVIERTGACVTQAIACGGDHVRIPTTVCECAVPIHCANTRVMWVISAVCVCVCVCV